MSQIVYWNSKQLAFLRATVPFKMFLGGRGSGKTTTEGGEQYRSMASMPRSKGFLAGSTYAQLLNNTLPAVEAKWGEMGLTEGEDYVVGVRPPATFTKSLDEPRKYENVISFQNGRRLVLMSMDRPDLQRGGTYVDGALDEAALVPHEHLTRVMIPSLRGMVKEFDTPLRGVMRCYTSIPWKPSGYWCLDYEAKAKAAPSMYHWSEANAYDNVHVLGADYIHRLQTELPYLEFLVEVMNERVRKVKDAFYNAFDPDKHTYEPRFVYGESVRGISLSGVADDRYDPNLLLDASFDFSGYFNCATIWQQSKTKTQITENCISQVFVKSEEGKVAELVDKICQAFANHKFKCIRLWGEPRGHDPKADTRRTIFQQIHDRFTANAWQCEVRVKPGAVKSHRERHYYMNEVLAETNPKYPVLRFNANTCKDAVIAMQVTGMVHDFQKDKSMERDRNYPQQHAPHFTDTIDYYIYQKYGAQSMGAPTRGALDVRMG